MCQELERQRDNLFQSTVPRILAASRKGLEAHKEAIGNAQDLLNSELRAIKALPQGSQAREFRSESADSLKQFLQQEAEKVQSLEERQAIREHRW